MPPADPRPRAAATAPVHAHGVATGPGGAALASLAAATGACAGVAAWHASDAPPLSVAWIPAWDVSLVFRLDALSAAYALLATGVAVLVACYAWPYMSGHLREHERSAASGVTFHLLMAIFMAAMVGLVTSGDLLQLFVFWDVTAICSSLLIAFDRTRAAGRAALVALIVTGIPAVLLLAGVLVVRARYGTSDPATLAALARPDGPTVLACWLFLVAALAKSAQWPLHFWLPRAMAAPTPVSAYLHAAAMVAAGVYLLQRLQPLLHAVPGTGLALVALGWCSLAAGGLAALRENRLKRILAWSTVAQYGHVVLLVGLGGAHAAAAATFFVVAHGLCKSALFLSAGAVTRATGETRLSSLGGLGRPLLPLAVATALAAAGLAGLPLTVGYFKDELLFDAAWRHGGAALLMAMTGPVLTVAYMWRFWSGIFLGPCRTPVRVATGTLTWPIGAAALLIAIAGVWPGPLASLAEASATEVVAPVTVEAAYPTRLSAPAMAALGALAAGALLAARRRRLPAAWLMAAATGPERLAWAALQATRRAGRWVRDHRPRQIRARLAVVVTAAATIVTAGLAARGMPAAWPAWTPVDPPLAAALCVTALAAVLTAREARHLTLVVSISMTTLALAAVLALAGAPDVALILATVNVISSLLLVALLRRLPRAQPLARVGPAAPWRGTVAAAGAAMTYLVASGTLDRAPPPGSQGIRYVDLAGEAHAANAVTAVLVDFRGLDTLGEITVVLVGVMAVERLVTGRAQR